MSNAAAFAALDAQIRRLQALGNIETTAAPAVAAALESTLDAQIAAATDPQGRAWEPRKADGAAALQTAGSNLVVVPVGKSVVARLTGHIAMHNNGVARGRVKRQILPTKRIPELAAKAIAKALEVHFARIMKGDP